MSLKRRWLAAVAILIMLLAAAVAGWMLLGAGDPRAIWESVRAWLGETALSDDFALGNGRIEATEVDVATKLAGRLAEVRVREGDRVESGQVVAVLDTEALAAQRRQAQAELRRARQEREHAVAVVEQHASELDYARRDLTRLQRLSGSDRFVSEEQVDQARTRVRTAEAALRASQVQVVATEAAIEAAQASIERIEVDIADSSLKAPRGGRVLYRLAEPGEVLAAGGKVLTLLDLSDVYMVIFLPTTEAGRVPIGAEARLVLDAAPEYVVPAEVSFVAPRAQFTPKQVETQSVRETLAFRVKVRIAPDLLARYEDLVKTGVPGVAYVRMRPEAAWPDHLAPRLPPWPSPPALSSD
ncbi:MAG: HlyD family secretion protein [Bdellovibrio bacteriovorus]